jgi:Reverse transcriptase (RNA-dependent DNA polymerase)
MPKKIYKHYKLESSPFYKLQSKRKLAEILFTSPKTIKEICALPDLYTRKWKHKKEKDTWLETPYPSESEMGNYRPIDISHPRLKILQSRIAELLGRIAPPEYLFSPVKGKSYVDNAVRHVHSKAFWMLDIADYFPSCSANNVAWFFTKIMRCSPDVTAILVKLSTYNKSLPQGSPCSPILAYFSNLNMWENISELANRHECTISVYADDITLSSRHYVPRKVVWEITQRVQRQGLRVKKEKETSIIDKPALITGVIIFRERALLPNKQHKALTELKRDHATETNHETRIRIAQQISGRRAQKGQIENCLAARKW